MNEENDLIQYPRKVFIRKFLILLGKILLWLLARVQVIGKDKLPKRGPIILAGNHIAALEAVMMAAYTPGLVEFFGNGDIPFDPNYAWVTKAYDLIPINRGNLDRKGMRMALDVLKQNGILGIFPEGGTWNPAQMDAQTGIAWLSYKAQAPILPIGFGGTKGALGNALKLKRPKLAMHVGDLLSPVTIENDTLSLKENLQLSANHIISEIKALIPEEDLQAFQRTVDEEFDLEIEFLSLDGEVIDSDVHIEHGAAYAHLLYTPNLLDVLVRNLQLPIKPIKFVYKRSEISPLLEAWESILNYLEVNPGFFTYRFGIDEGLGVKQSLIELQEIAKRAQKLTCALTITPIRHYRNNNTGAQVNERGGCFPNSL